MGHFPEWSRPLLQAAQCAGGVAQAGSGPCVRGSAGLCEFLKFQLSEPPGLVSTPLACSLYIVVFTQKVSPRSSG